jgi:hypothetical protein
MFRSYCAAGALWAPPLNRGGRTVYVTFAASPRNKLSAPDVPGVEDVCMPGNCQHSSVDAPLAAEIAVRFNAGVVTSVSCACTGLQARRHASAAHTRGGIEDLDMMERCATKADISTRTDFSQRRGFIESGLASGHFLPLASLHPVLTHFAFVT